MRKFSWFTTKRSKNGMYYGIGLYNLDEGLFVKYKPNMKGGHTHNHLKNMELRLMLTKKEIKALRKIMKREKKNGRN